MLCIVTDVSTNPTVSKVRKPEEVCLQVGIIASVFLFISKLIDAYPAVLIKTNSITTA